MSRSKRAMRASLLLIFYLGVAVIVTWPLISAVGTRLPGPSTDALLHFWNAWWVREALQGGHAVYFTPYLFHPNGVSLVYHNLPWFNILPWLPLQGLLDDIVAYNVVFLLNLALCGLAAFWLAYRLTGHGLVAVPAGLIYQAWPFRLSQLDHPNLVATYWIPLFFLALYNLLERPTRRRALLAGLLLALVGYTRWQQLIPVVPMTLLFVALVARRLRDRRAWSMLLLAGATSALLLLPPFLMLVRAQMETPATADDLLREGEEQLMQTDVLAYLTPPADHPFLGQHTSTAYDRYYPERAEPRRFPAYLGVVAIILTAVGLAKRTRESLPWLAMALLLIGLALGPVLRIGGQLQPGMPMLYRLLEPLFVLRLVRVPDRFNLFLALPIAMMAALGLSVLLVRLKGQGQWLPRLASAGLGALILLEYLAIPVATQSTEVSTFYTDVEEGEALLNLPIDPIQSKEYMFAQTIHEQPILHGHISRVPPDAYSFIDNHPWLRVIRQSREMPPWLTDISRQLDSLHDVGVSYIVFHKGLTGSDRIEHWQRYLPFRPQFEDDAIIVYSTTPRAGEHYTLQRELHSDIGPIMTNVSAACVRPGDPLAVDVAWAATRSPEEPFEVRLSLENDQEVALRETTPVSEGWPADTWPSGTVLWDYHTLLLPAAISPGSYDVRLALPGSGEVSSPLTLGQVTVAEECPLDLPPDAVPLDARFGDELHLLGYTRHREGEQLTLTLHWQSLQRMDQDYKVFVHVFETATGRPVAQDDAMPHRGGYPTRFWWPGETVVDHIPIYLQDAPAGSFGLAVGVYDPATLERLPLQESDGSLVPDGRLILPGETIEISP